jgi:hypothetical protein
MDGKVFNVSRPPENTFPLVDVRQNHFVTFFFFCSSSFSRSKMEKKNQTQGASVSSLQMPESAECPDDSSRSSLGRKDSHLFETHLVGHLHLPQSFFAALSLSMAARLCPRPSRNPHGIRFLAHSVTKSFPFFFLFFFLLICSFFV